jgi:hypothetical protein
MGIKLLYNSPFLIAFEIHLFKSEPLISAAKVVSPKSCDNSIVTTSSIFHLKLQQLYVSPSSTVAIGNDISHQPTQLYNINYH